jgi:uroporphyrinogen-III synthase
MIEIAPPADTGPLRRAAREVDEYDWIIFSSTNAVAALAEYVEPGRGSPRARIAVVGAATRDAVEALGWKVDVVPQEFVAESLTDALSSSPLQAKHILLPAAAVTRDVIPRALRERGALVDVVEAYRNVMPEGAAAQARGVFSQHPQPDWVTFTSSSCVDNLVSAVGAGSLSNVRIASIGPVTSATVRRHGLSIHAEPEEHTITGLVEAIQTKTEPGTSATY